MSEGSGERVSVLECGSPLPLLHRAVIPCEFHRAENPRSGAPGIPGIPEHCIFDRTPYHELVQAPESVRIDKWLWAVRLYKSRSLAIRACEAGHVKVGAQRVKPSREVRPGEVITALTGVTNRTVKVLALLQQRVGAPRVKEFLDDLTPPEEYARARAEALQALPRYSKGFGRPTKKQRRQMEAWNLQRSDSGE